MVEIKITKDTITPHFNEIKNRLKPARMKAFMKTMHPIMARNINRAFDDKKYFAGKRTRKWKKLADSTIQRRKKKGTWPAGGILQETYSMFLAIKANSKVGGSKGVYHFTMGPPPGSEKRKVLEHMRGSSHMPARPPLTIFKETTEEFRNRLIRYLFK